VWSRPVALDLRLCIFRRRGQKRGSQDFDWSSLGVFRSWRVDLFTYRRYELLVERKSRPFRRHLTERYAGRTIAALHRHWPQAFDNLQQASADVSIILLARWQTRDSNPSQPSALGVVCKELFQSEVACVAGFLPGSELNARLFHGKARCGSEFPTVPVWCREAMCHVDMQRRRVVSRPPRRRA